MSWNLSCAARALGPTLIRPLSRSSPPLTNTFYISSSTYTLPQHIHTHQQTMAFSFGFSGDDIDDVDAHEAPQATTTAAAAPSAFPVPGKPQLPAAAHSLADLLARLPSKVAYSSLSVLLDDGTAVQLPRRELWDVRVQLMAEEDGDAEAAEGLGKHDVKTGVYEGGFKSWESSVDLVKVLAADPSVTGPRTSPLSVMEVSCVCHQSTHT